MKKRTFSLVGLVGLFLIVSSISSCDKQKLNGPTISNSHPYGFEIKDTINPVPMDSSFTFNPTGTLASATDMITSGALTFTYNNTERQSSSPYQYGYDVNSNLVSIALRPGTLGRDSLLLYPNGRLKTYKKAAGFNSQGVPVYMIYSYNYGAGVIPASGPTNEPLNVLGKGNTYDAEGNVTFIFTDSIQIQYAAPFSLGFTPLMTICNDASVHFINLRLWCDVPMVTNSCISKITRSTYNNVELPGRLPVVTTTSDLFTYGFDAKVRPNIIIKNGVPAYTIYYHD